MNPEIEAQIRNVQKFGRYARGFCVLLGAMLVFTGVWLVFNILTGPTGSGFRVALGAYSVTGDNMATPQVKAWSLLVALVVMAILFKGLFHLFRLFTNLAGGAIYTKANVRHIRQLGLLALAAAVLQIAVFAITAVLIEIGFIDRSLVTGGEAGLGPFSFDSFIMAALVLLASWIMDVGRQTTDEADALRREVDLVI